MLAKIRGLIAAKKSAKQPVSQGNSSRRLLPLLLLLVVAGGGAFLYLNGGLTTYIEPLLQMAGLQEAPAPAPVIKRKPIKVAKAPASKTLNGTIHGQVFSLTTAELKQGLLTLKQGNGLLPDRSFSIKLDLDKWELPTNRTYSASTDSTSSQPQIKISWREPNQDLPSSIDINAGYTMTLAFKGTNKNKLAGQLSFESAEHGTRINGNFSAEIKSFVIDQGKPNLHVDSSETLTYLALADLLKESGNTSISSAQYSNAKIDKASSNASLDIVYVGEKGKTISKEYRYEKNKSGWNIRKNQ